MIVPLHIYLWGRKTMVMSRKSTRPGAGAIWWPVYSPVMRSIYVIFVTSVAAYGQEQPERVQDFSEMRKKEFSNLIGGTQEGASLFYSADKTALEGSLGSDLKKWHSFLQFKGSVGTSTNLSKLFDSKTLPTFSGSITVHRLIPGALSRFFYDGNFSANLDAISDGSATADNITAGDSRFGYTESFRER